MNKVTKWSAGLLATCCSLLISCSPVNHQDSTAQHQQKLRQAIAQKLMIDLRYYCDNTTPDTVCREPMTILPATLHQLIQQNSIGGVILFSDNLKSTEQIITLTHDLQKAAIASAAAQPMFIGIDQEGGRVFRTPRHLTTAFSGSMAIGATAAQHGNHFATETGRIMAQELKALGINVNFAPTVDVNVNPQNPVINIRSFGENPQLVSDLALAQLRAMQQQKVLGTLKHFPGHGDTHVDSHTGLPLVTHDRATIDAVDLLPFKQIIAADAPAMIMTAHIQFPALDSSTLTDLNGQPQIRPATLSRAILTDLLRNELAYKGLIVTDALDMAGISHFFDATQAVIETFKAGADIAIMPLRLHNRTDLPALEQLINDVTDAITRGELSEQEVLASAARIEQMKQQYQLKNDVQSDLVKAVSDAEKVLGSPQNRQLETQLAEASITVIRGQQKLPLPASTQKLALLMPDTSSCLALQQALETEKADLATQCSSLQSYHAQTAKAMIEQSDAVLIASVTPASSAVELGGMEDLQQIRGQALSHQQIKALTPEMMAYAKSLNKPLYFVSLRTPYETSELATSADAVLVTYGYNTHQDGSFYKDDIPKVTGPAYAALAKVLTGKITATGTLPVTVGK